ncbi:MAG: HD domain-containing protein [Patescibacteria group bacterium]|jgi:putative hydrolase of HD superfamily
MESDEIRSANYLFEIGIHAKTPRSGFWFLGSGEQSLAEHEHRIVHVGLALASLAGDVDVAKVMQMCLFHDIAEGRTSDLNYVHQLYATANEDAAINDIVASVPFGGYMKPIIDEYKERVSKESLLAKDADNIELLLSLKEQADIGNTRTELWITVAKARVKTEEGKRLADAILATDSMDWWRKDKDVQEYWIDRKHHGGHDGRKD